MTDLGRQLAVQVTSGRDVTLRDVVTAGTSLLAPAPRTAAEFSSRTPARGALHVSGRKPVFARQPRHRRRRHPHRQRWRCSWTILGLKTEGDCTVLDNRRRSEQYHPRRAALHRGCMPIPPCRHFATRMAACWRRSSRKEESFRPHEEPLTAICAGQRKVDASAFRARGYGRIVPWLSTGH